jgi:hypothetical protein
VRPFGRPPKRLAAATDGPLELTRAVLSYVLQTGCVHRGRARQYYSDAFRCFILDLRAEFPSLEVEAFAVPLDTLKAWLRLTAAPDALTPQDAPAAQDGPNAHDLESALMQTVLDAYSRWDGSLGLLRKTRLRLPFGRDLLTRIFAVHGLRRCVARNGRSPDESALRTVFW